MDNLTPRQKDVLAWVLQGQSNKAIAKRLGITESTVKLHMTALLYQHGVQTRAQLIAFNGQTVAPPTGLEPVADAWIKRAGKSVKGIVFQAKQPDPSWERIYLKAKGDGDD